MKENDKFSLVSYHFRAKTELPGLSPLLFYLSQNIFFLLLVSVFSLSHSQCYPIEV